MKYLNGFLAVLLVTELIATMLLYMEYAYHAGGVSCAILGAAAVAFLFILSTVDDGSY